MRKFWIVLALGLAACSPPDFCSDPALTGQSCLTVEVEGQLTPKQAQVDSLQVDVRFYASSSGSDAFLYRATITNTADGGGASGLPVAFPVVLPVRADPSEYIYNSVTVLALNQGAPLGLGHASFRFAVNGHSGVKVSLSPATLENKCFDGIQDFNETDVDCGGDACPACPDGKGCRSGETDCAYHVCGGYPSVCGGTS